MKYFSDFCINIMGEEVADNRCKLEQLSGVAAITPERQNMTRHSPYHGDKLSRLALSSEMSERRHTLWNQMVSGRPHTRRLFCKDIWRQPVFIPQVNLVADLIDAVLRRCRTAFSPAMGRGLRDITQRPTVFARNASLIFFPARLCLPAVLICVRSPHFVHSIISIFSMRGLKVLLVEDDDDARALYVYMLATAGYRVNAVSNGLEALAEIQVNRPDVIVTDILMPVLSGLDLIIAVRSDDELADLPVVAITSFGEDFRDQARAAGAVDAIDKPTEIERMREVIEAAVSRPS